MAKKITGTKKDKHASGFMVRLPEKFRGLLAQLCEKTRRPKTIEVQMALEKHLAEAGLWPTGDGQTKTALSA